MFDPISLGAAKRTEWALFLMRDNCSAGLEGLNGNERVTDELREEIQSFYRDCHVTRELVELYDRFEAELWEALAEDAGEDLAALGFHLDVLKIQNVSDERGYLEAIGRKRAAEAVRDAEIAEANATAETTA